MSRSAIFTFSLVILLVAACKKELPNLADPPDQQALQGRWQWVQQTRSVAVGASPYVTVRADSTGIAVFLNMNADLTWSLVANGWPLRNGRYGDKTLFSPDGPLTMLDFVIGRKDSTVNHWLSDDQDTLYTSNIGMDPTYNVDMYVRHRY